MTNDEMEKDFEDTTRDIHNLFEIVQGLEGFITQSGGEDRSWLKADLFKYKGLLAQARELKEKIYDHWLSEKKGDE